MPPRQASRCYRVLQNQTSSALETVWITDNVLSRAFERYCSVSLVSRRQASAVPGPLENRRRLGKRRMTELNSQQLHAPLPPWALPNVMDLSQWRWEAPTPAAVRTNGANESVSPWPFPNLQAPQWLVDWAEKKEDMTYPRSDRKNIKKTGYKTVESLSNQFDALGAAEELSLADFVQEFRGLCTQLEQQLTLGTIMPEELNNLLSKAFGTADAKLRTSLQSSRRPLAQLLFSSAIRGISSCKLLGADTFAISYWRTVLLRTTDLPVTDELCRVLGIFIKNAPRQSLDSLSSGILSVLDKVFLAWGEPRYWDLSAVSGAIDQARDASKAASDLLATAVSHAEAHDFIRAKTVITEASTALTASRRYMNKAARAMLSNKSYTEAVANSLKELSADDSAPLLRAATELVLIKPFRREEMQRQMRYAWLTVLARAPTVDERLLLQLGSMLFPPATGGLSLSGTEICRLLVIHWKSAGYLKNFKDRRDYVDRVCSDSDVVAMASLAQAVFRAESPETSAALFESLWKFLAAFGRSEALVASIKALGAVYRLSPRFLQTVASTSNDHHVAMAMHTLCVEQSHQPGMQWEPAFWDKFVDAMAADPAVKPFYLLRVLGAETQPLILEKEARRSLAGLQGQRRRRRICATPRSVAHVERMATQLAHTEHLHNRVALRWVSLCVRYLARHKRRLSVSSLQALGRVITRDLAEGRAGRTSRLQWYVQLVSRHLGDHAGLAAAAQLKRWRDGSYRLWLAEQRRANYRPRL